MNKMQTQVREFHGAFGVPVNNKPVVSIAKKRLLLRAALIYEEMDETIRAMGCFHSCEEVSDDGEGVVLDPDSKGFNIAEIADGLTDLLYVTFGAMIELGLDAEKCFDEVHRSNMTKLWSHVEADEAQELGTNPSELSFHECPQKCVARQFYVAKRQDGKIIKSPSYSPADLSSVISKQML